MAEALNTCTLSVQCPPEHLHVLSASIQGTGTSYSGARQGVFLCYKTPCPRSGVGLLQSRDNNTVEKMNQNKPDGRCATGPQWDRWHIRIPKLEDQQKISSYTKSRKQRRRATLSEQGSWAKPLRSSKKTLRLNLA